MKSKARTDSLRHPIPDDNIAGARCPQLCISNADSRCRKSDVNNSKSIHETPNNADGDSMCEKNRIIEELSG